MVSPCSPYMTAPPKLISKALVVVSVPRGASGEAWEICRDDGRRDGFQHARHGRVCGIRAICEVISESRRVGVSGRSAT